MIACGLLTSGAAARADSEHGTCSDRTLRGDYASAVKGEILPAPGISLRIIGVVMTHYDGKGTFTQVDHIVVNGEQPAITWTPGVGTYRVNADCSGTAHIVLSTGGFVNLSFVVIREGDEIRAVVAAPFDGPPRTVTSVGKRAE